MGENTQDLDVPSYGKISWILDFFKRPMVHMRFKTRMSELEKIISFVEFFFKKKNVPSNRLKEILVAVDEVATNIIQFAYDTPEGGPLDIILDTDRGRSVITFMDKGKPFDPTSVKKPDINKPLQDRQPGGLGIHLVRTLMDGVKYEYKDGEMNVLTLTKNNLFN